jgi:DNA/RNA endonuclease G (NUC1)
MRRFRSISTAIVAGLLVSCSSDRVTAPGESRTAPPAPAASPVLDAVGDELVRISEIHYDNAGTDVGEAIEIAGPAGFDLSGWQLVLYNGTGGVIYGTSALTGTLPNTCDGRGVLTISYPVNGIQNGSPDGMALISRDGTVVEFLSYEGTFAATNGPAIGVTSTSIGVAEAGTEPVGQSLQRRPDGSWAPPAASSFGVCNDTPIRTPAVAAVVITAPVDTLVVDSASVFAAAAFAADRSPLAVSVTWSSTNTAVAIVSPAGTVTGVSAGTAEIIATAPNGVADTATIVVVAPAGPPPPPPPAGPVFLSELHYDNTGTDADEAVEIEGPAGLNVTGWSIVLYNGNGGVVYSTRTLSGTIPSQCDGRGTLALTYAADGIQNGAPDGVALIDASGTVLEFRSYEGVMTATAGPAAGQTSVDIGVSQSNAPIGQTLARNAAGTWTTAARSIGDCNSNAVVPGNVITFSGRTAGDPALPVGFEDQLFATLRNPITGPIATTITWSSDTPAIASVDSNGVVQALAAGTAVLRATATDGTTNTIALPTRVAESSPVAQYGNHTEFGIPADGTPSDDFLVRYREYTASWSAVRGTPNWVAYNLEATHIGAEDRCDCFTFDPALSSVSPRYTTADYTGVAAINGFGIDRGHLARSFDRTAGSLDNAQSFRFTNIIPQASDQNQGPWAVLEDSLGKLALNANREVFIVAGVAGANGTVKNEGKIVIPAFTWKVALVLPRDRGLADVQALGDVEVIAVVMPNVPGIRNVPWTTYKTTIDSVEALSGYDLNALLRDDLEIAIESNTKPPTATVDGPFTASEGSPVTMSGLGSTDPDGDALTYAWSFGDGATAVGPSVTHTYAQDGAYTVRLIVTDPRGLADTVITSATVSNVAPTLAPFAGATLFRGETYVGRVEGADVGADALTLTVTYGDGSPSESAPLVNGIAPLRHRYLDAGRFTVTAQVSDGVASAEGTATVTVLSEEDGIRQLQALVQDLFTRGAIKQGTFRSLTAKLQIAWKKADRDRDRLAIALLRIFRLEVDLTVRLGLMKATDAEPLRTLTDRLLAALRL